MSAETAKAISDLIAQRFISRTDVKAQQHPGGAYTPVRERWTRQDIISHLAGDKTFGHYVIGADDTVKVITFDIDLTKTGILPASYDSDGLVPTSWYEESDLRGTWKDRKKRWDEGKNRQFLKVSLRTLADKLARATHELLGIDVAVAYSGNKGLHVYGFTGKISAADAREGALLVVEDLGLTPSKGEIEFRHPSEDPFDGYGNLTVEVYPKQDSLQGKDLGNLVRLPLGRNQRSSDPAFFVDLTLAATDLRALDPVYALTEGSRNPWKRQGE
jgi:hypothetical protein